MTKLGRNPELTVAPSFQYVMFIKQLEVLVLFKITDVNLFCSCRHVATNRCAYWKVFEKPPKTVPISAFALPSLSHSVLFDLGFKGVCHVD